MADLDTKKKMTGTIDAVDAESVAIELKLAGAERKKKKVKEIVCSYTVDHEVAAMYASKKCSDCWGRGIVKYQTGVLKGGTIRKDLPIEDKIRYCNCVRRNSKKYG